MYKRQGNYIEVGGFWDDAKDFLGQTGKAGIDIAAGYHESVVRSKIAQEQAEAKAKQGSMVDVMLPYVVVGGLFIGGVWLLSR